MKAPTPQDRQNAIQARLVALVIMCTIVLWVAAQWVGGQMGWDTRYAILFDLAALAAFFWALVVTYQLWRKRRT